MATLGLAALRMTHSVRLAHLPRTYTYSRSTVNSTIIIRHSSCAQHAFCVHWHGVFGDMYACTRVMHLAVCSTHVCNVHACTCQMNHDVHALYTYVYIHTSPYTYIYSSSGAPATRQVKDAVPVCVVDGCDVARYDCVTSEMCAHTYMPPPGQTISMK